MKRSANIFVAGKMVVQSRVSFTHTRGHRPYLRRGLNGKLIRLWPKDGVDASSVR